MKRRLLLSLSCPVVAIGAVALFFATRYGGQSSGSVVVLGASSIDFGTVRDTARILLHSFVLENRTGTAQRIAGVKRACGCLDAKASSDLISSGGSASVAVSMDAKQIVGTKETQAVVVFEDRDVTPVALHIKAYVEPQYAVQLDPLVVPIPRGTAPGTRGERTVNVTEYLTEMEDYERETMIAIEEGKGFRIKEVKPWKAKGWSFTRGYIRTTEMTLEYEVPREWTSASRAPVSIRFEKRGDKGKRPREAIADFALWRL